MFARDDERADDDMRSKNDVFTTGDRREAFHDVCAGHDRLFGEGDAGDDKRTDDDLLGGDDKCAHNDVRPCHNVRTKGLLSTLRLATLHDLLTGDHERSRNDAFTGHDLGSGVLPVK